jgi:hypothetical protein
MSFYRVSSRIQIFFQTDYSAIIFDLMSFINNWWFISLPCDFLLFLYLSFRTYFHHGVLLSLKVFWWDHNFSQFFWMSCSWNRGNLLLDCRLRTNQKLRSPHLSMSFFGLIVQSRKSHDSFIKWFSPPKFRNWLSYTWLLFSNEFIARLMVSPACRWFLYCHRLSFYSVINSEMNKISCWFQMLSSIYFYLLQDPSWFFEYESF